MSGRDCALRRGGVCQALVDDSGGLFDRSAHHRSRRAPHRKRAWQHHACHRQSQDDAMSRHRGFSFIELVVSMAIMLAVTSSMFGFVHSARSVFEIDIERADMQQRARVSMDALFRDLVMAGAGRPDAGGRAFPPRRYRSGFARIGVLRSHLRSVCAARRRGRRVRHHYICAARRCRRRASSDEVRRPRDRAAAGRSGCEPSLRVLRRRWAANRDRALYRRAMASERSGCGPLRCRSRRRYAEFARSCA